jgi:hypothetical protein
MKILIPILAALVLIVGVAGVAQAGIEAPPGALGATKPGTFVKDPFLDTIGPTGYLLFENQKNQLTCAIPVKSVQTSKPRSTSRLIPTAAATTTRPSC